MISERALRGYLLEEALAWMLRGSAYDLLVSVDQDPDELVPHGADLLVRGRGANHQVDVLGQFSFTPAFSLPVRLFLEAKFNITACSLGVVRNAFGVIQDVNQNFVIDHRSARPKRRFQYCYALFSTKGFSPAAQDFALAHQISLVDLSGKSFETLLDVVSGNARTLHSVIEHYPRKSLPVAWIRGRLRSLLGTDPMGTDTAPSNQLADGYDLTGTAEFFYDAQDVLNRFALDLQGVGIELLIGFPAAPFVIPLTTTDKTGFLRYADTHSSHRVQLRRSGDGSQAEWVASPYGDSGGYDLRFTLPQEMESWIGENEDLRRTRTASVKADWLSDIMIYYQANGGVRACQLRYEPSQLRRP